MLKAIIFDIDGVLLNSFEANLKFFQTLLLFAGYKPPTSETFRKMFHMPMDQVIKKLIAPADENEVQRIWLMGKNRAVPYPSELITVTDSCEKTLKILAKKYTLAIVTSRIKVGVFSLPQLANLENLFQTAVCFEDTEKHKPEPEPLLLACERLQIRPSEAIYIGDAQTDMDAAKAAGMKAIAFTKDELLEASATTHEFSEIPKLIEKKLKPILIHH